ncbi:MAG: hypothetical protein HOV81_43700 [Kofleriaceae bacterium]|nr:hypothetical protein [Kofleriaceae bacterium]
MKRTLIALALASIVPSVVSAQPSPSLSGDKVDAKALLASGLKLFAAKDYLGALAVFKDAYARFPSSKILINIGTTLKALGRNAEAANTYQRYLDASDSEAGKKADVAKVLAELDAKLGILDITVTPDDAEVQIGHGDWEPAKDVAHIRVDPGSAVVRARRDGYTGAESTVEAVAGAHQTVTLTLAAIPVATNTTTGGAATLTDGGIGTRVESEPPPGKLGVFAYAHVDPKAPGAAGYVGASYEVISRLQVEAAAILGPKFGGYVAARYAFLDGMFRPTITAGMPVFVSDGARYCVRGAGGLEVALHRRLSIVAEFGVEHMFNPEANIASTLIVPAVGAVGRL